MVLMLNDYKDLFKDENCYHRFVAVFQKALREHGMPLVFMDKEIVFTALSPESTKKLLSERILRRLSKDPELLTELQHRLEDPIVE